MKDKKKVFVISLILIVLIAIGLVYISQKGVTPEVPTLPPAPYVSYIKVGENLSFTYWGYNISINYLSANPHYVEIKVNGKVIKEINKSIDDSPRGVYWSFKDLIFELKPVIWKINIEGRKIPYYEETWNTTELLFEVQYAGKVPPQTQLPNPSAIYCKYLGYEYKIIKEERGVCVFPNGRECDSWLFFAGRCGQEFSYCERFGNGKIDVMPESCAYSKECAVCILPDGTRCLEFEYALGRCP